MEQVIDKLVEEIQTLADEGPIGGLEITDVKWDDPGIVLTVEYPYIFVAPMSEESASETMGRAGYDIRNLFISVGIVINQADYFDPTVSVASGSKELVRAAGVIRSHVRRLNLRSLGGISRNVVVPSINYVPEIRGEAFARMAVITLVVQRQYQHTD